MSFLFDDPSFAEQALGPQSNHNKSLHSVEKLIVIFDKLPRTLIFFYHYMICITLKNQFWQIFQHFSFGPHKKVV